MNVNERVARYLAATPAAISGNYGHRQTFAVACNLLHGWALPPQCALCWLQLYNQRCRPKWTRAELMHKIDGASKADHHRAAGHLLGLMESEWASSPRPKAKGTGLHRTGALAAEALSSADHAPVSAEWLAARSPLDPASQTPATFLRALYYEGEHVMIFDKLRSVGQAIWRHTGATFDARALDRFSKGAACGVWFLCNPVDGVRKANCEGKLSLRSEGNITAWRYLVLESDRTDISVGDWLTAIARLPLRVAAIVETGGRLHHALVRVDAPSKKGWDEIRDSLKPVLVSIGADEGALSAVRLSRLACCERLGREDKDGIYRGFEDGPHLQRLLYLDPEPDGRPIAEGGIR
jgi:hypothetical protein